jgi:hypothetical protein
MPVCTESKTVVVRLRHSSTGTISNEEHPIVEHEKRSSKPLLQANVTLRLKGAPVKICTSTVTPVSAARRKVN